MKLFLSLLFAIFFSLSSFSQNGVYLYGFMENAPENPVQIDVMIFGDSTMIPAILFTEPSGDIPIQWFEFPPEEFIVHIEAGFYNCQGNYVFQSWAAEEFDNLIDIPLNFNYCADSIVYGCTDPEAINYNPQATQNDGSCEYEVSCDLNEVTVNVITQLWGHEIEWNLMLDSTSVATGENYQNNSTYSADLCLADGCYLFEMYDSFGDGWNGSIFQIIVNGAMIQTGTLQSGNYGSVSFGINQDGCSDTPPVSGCTDPLAINYNPIATIDDGSCEYMTVAENDLCENAIQLIADSTISVNNTYAFQNEGIWGECWGFGQGEGEQTSVWYSFTTPDYPASIHLEALYDGSSTLTDTQFGIFESCGGPMIYCDGNAGEGLMSALDFECGELAENTTYLLILDGWNGDSGTCLLQYSVESACNEDVFGCTDPLALNYNPLATIDDGSCEYELDCDLNAIEIVISTQSWGNEISWHLLNADSTIVASGGGYNSNMNYNTQWCLADGCYTFQMFDTFGDGWNGGSFEVIFDNEVLASGSLISGQNESVNFGINQDGCSDTLIIYGCTDPEALNYNPDATADDGSCQYPTNCTEISIMLDNNGLASNWILSSSDGYFSTGFYPGSDLNILDCLEDGCYTFQLDSNVTDVYFNLFIDNQILVQDIINGYDVVEFEIGSGCDSTSVIYGCTDVNAYNYNPAATVDDGSCIYQFECSIDFLVIPDSTGEEVIWIVPSENIFAAAEVLWDFGDGTTSTELFPSHSYTGDGPYTLCLTATFSSATGGSCSITYCVVLTGDMIGGSGFTQSEGGFTINVVGDDATVGIAAPESVSNLSLWPNPANDKLNVRFNSLNNGIQNLEIIDITGKIILEQQFTAASGVVTENIDISGLNSGIYIFKLSSANQVETSRFVVTK